MTTTSDTLGNIFVDTDIICVNIVASTMCHVVKNIGKGKCIVSNTALLNRIYKIFITHDHFKKNVNLNTIVQLIEIQNTI